MPCCLSSVGPFQWFLCLPCLVSHQDPHYNPKVQWFLHFYLPEFTALPFQFSPLQEPPRPTVFNPIMPESPEERGNPALKPKPPKFGVRCSGWTLTHLCCQTSPGDSNHLQSSWDFARGFPVSSCKTGAQQLSRALLSLLQSEESCHPGQPSAICANRNSSLPHSTEDKWSPLFDPIFPVTHLREHWYSSVDSRLLEEGTTACLTLYLP